MKLAARMIAAACAFGVLPGCLVSVEPTGVSGPPPIVLPAGDGSLTVNWVVAGTTSPAVCEQYDAEQIEVVVYDETGQPVTRATEPCGTFRLSLALPVGTYTADVTLLDRRGSARSTTKTLYALNVIEGTDLALSIDFPSSSIRRQ